MTERPEVDELQSATGIHARVRYAFAAQSAAAKRVLDIACGNGFGTLRLAEVASAVVGVDNSREAIATARSRFPHPNVRYEHVVSTALPFRDGDFDVVVCLETLEHLSRGKQSELLSELARVLRPDGILIVSTPDQNAERKYELATGAFNPWHVHTPSREDLDAALRVFPHRLAFGVADFVATVIGPDGSRGTPEVEPLTTEIAAPFTRLQVCASQSEPLDTFHAASFGHSIAFRIEPRLKSVDAIMDSLPSRIRWPEIETEQTRRAEASFTPQTRVGSSAWWHREAAYAFTARIACGRRVLDVGSGFGAGAARLRVGAKHVVATEAPGPRIEAARARYEDDGLRFIASPSLLPAGDEEFDVIVCLSSADGKGDVGSRLPIEAMKQLASDGIVITDHRMPDLPVVTLRVVDLVATAIIREGSNDLRPVRLEGEFPDAPAARELYAIARTETALARVRDLPPIAVFRGDFQKEALAAQLYLAPQVHDLAGFGADERDEILALRLARLERQIEAEVATLSQRLDDAYGRLPLISVRGWLRRVWRTLKGTR